MDGSALFLMALNWGLKEELGLNLSFLGEDEVEVPLKRIGEGLRLISKLRLVLFLKGSIFFEVRHVEARDSRNTVLPTRVSDT